MAKIKEVSGPGDKRAILIRVDYDLAEALDLIGKGKMSTGAQHVLDTYKKEILEAAKKIKRHK